MTTRVAIILINWNGTQDTLACLGSLATQSYGDCITIVVDNHSNEDISVINVNYPDVLVIQNLDNLGFCGGNNIGINKAAELNAEFCWILNNDTEVAPDCLAHLVNALVSDPGVAAVAHPIIYYDDRRLYWFAGGVFRNGLPRHRDYMAPIAEVASDGATTEYLTGCSFLARTRVLQELDGFDERYFCYVEDVDLSVRIKEQGYGIGYVPEAVVWHKVSRSAGVRSPIKLYYKYRNMVYFLSKFKRPAGVKLRWWLRAARISVVLVLKHRQLKTAWYMIRGLLHGAKGRMGRIDA